MGNVKGEAYRESTHRISKPKNFQFYQDHAAVPYDDERWEKHRRTMHWFNPKVSLASRLAFNFAGQTVDFQRHRDDYQMVSAEL